MNAGVDAAFSARRQQDLVHIELLGILAVEFGRLPEREGKIGRADIDRIDPRHIEDLVNVLDSLAGFDHRNNEDLASQAGETSAKDQSIMAPIDRQYLARPYYGSRRMVAWLATQDHPVNRKRRRRRA